jgi:hypothetical protein
LSTFQLLQHLTYLSIWPRAGVYSKNSIEGIRRIVLNKMSSSDNTNVSKPPKFEGKRGATFVIWDIKFRSWAGVKEISGPLIPGFNSKQTSKEHNVVDKTELFQKAHGMARKQNAVAMDALVPNMSDTDNFHFIHQSMKEDANWPGGKAWKTWINIQHGTARDMTSALRKIK